jgi:2-oxoisovalerate dehydrogenase E1 component
VAAGMAMKPGYDWFFPYYRDRAICLALGNTVEEQLLQAVGAADDPASGGRQMPSHWSSKKAEYCDAVERRRRRSACMRSGARRRGGIFAASGGGEEAREGDYREFKDVKFHGDEVVYVSIGEGSTSQGEFWESLNTASNGKLPVLYVVEDNGYAISTPVEANTPGGNISRLIANFPNFHFAEIDGTDPIASYAAMVEAVAYCRAGNGPALVHGHVVRPYSHSLSDDERQYRSRGS